jgi:hypothetical protein
MLIVRPSPFCSVTDLVMNNANHTRKEVGVARKAVSWQKTQKDSLSCYTDGPFQSFPGTLANMGSL